MAAATTISPARWPIRSRKPRRAISLLEVILALTLLVVAMVMIGQLVNLGVTNAATARDLTQAQLLCETKLEELASGIGLLVPEDGLIVDGYPDWRLKVEVERLGSTGLQAVTVTATPADSRSQDSVSYSLTRWIFEEVTR